LERHLTLDPQIAPLIEASNAAAAELPPIWKQTVQDRRQAYQALSDVAGPGPELDRVDDTKIAGVPCRIYANEGSHGILVFIHGGGYVIGDLETHDQPCRQLALESGATVIAVHYRLAPEHPFPAGIDDAWAVLTELDATRDQYGANAKLALTGDSAGGNFSAVLALMARDSGLDLAAQLLVYPAVDVNDDSPSMTENGEGYLLTSEIIAWFSHNYAPDPSDWRASPLHAESHEAVAPAVVITAQYDPLRDQGILYANKLKAAGVEVTHTNYDGMVHAFFQLSPLCDAGKAAITQIAMAAKAALA
jgi:acetyl esterase